MDTATLTDEIRRAHLAIIRARMDNIDSMKQALDSQVVDLGGGGPVGELRLASLELARAHTSLREAFGSLSRPLLRPLKIYNLPDELLMDVFDYLRNRGGSHRADIQHIRLSCRRFNNTSSHLLVDTVHVGLNPKSLQHLNEVSCHPDISKGVRRLVAAVDVYNADFAHSVESFAVR